MLVLMGSINPDLPVHYVFKTYCYQVTTGSSPGVPNRELEDEGLEIEMVGYCPGSPTCIFHKLVSEPPFVIVRV